MKEEGIRRNAIRIELTVANLDLSARNDDRSYGCKFERHSLEKKVMYVSLYPSM
jgi:hypothetical protein